MEEYNNCTHFIATVVKPELDPHYPSFLDQEDALLTTGRLLRERPEEFRVRFVAGMNLNPCKSLHEHRDENLENILTAHIIFPSVGGQSSNWRSTIIARTSLPQW